MILGRLFLFAQIKRKHSLPPLSDHPDQAEVDIGFGEAMEGR